MNSTSVLVLGAGVSGLTTALCLAEAGHSVRVLSDRPPLKTTSAVAGAVWGPYACRDPRVLDWSVRTLTEFRKLAEVDPANSGVRFVAGLEAATYAVEAPEYASALPDFAMAESADLPPGFVSGWHYTVPIIDMPVYLAHLTAALRGRGVGFEFASVASLSELRGEAEVVVNCSGLGSRTIVPDPQLAPVRGQLVVLKNPGIDGFFSDYPESEEPTYFMSHGERVILGGVIHEGGTALEPDPEVSRGIIERCAAVEPKLGSAPVLAQLVGLRPGRPMIRLERVARAAGARNDPEIVVHNYGHGGSGVTVSWGCAQDVVALLG